MSGGERPAMSFILIPLAVLLLAFVLSLSKKPLGRWIGALPLVPVLIFSLLVSNSGGNGFAELRWGLGLYFSLLASLAASILGFMGQILPDNQKLLAQDQTSNAPEGLAWKTDLASVEKVITGHKLIIVAVILLLINFVASIFAESSLGKTVMVGSMLAAIVVGISAFLRVGAALRYEMTTRVAILILIICPLINLITLTVLAIRIAVDLKSIGIQVGLFGANRASSSQ